MTATTVSNQQIDLAWQDDVNAPGTTYKIYRDVTSGFAAYTSPIATLMNEDAT